MSPSHSLELVTRCSLVFGVRLSGEQQTTTVVTPINFKVAVLTYGPTEFPDVLHYDRPDLHPHYSFAKYEN